MRILSIDLAQQKSVACMFEAGTGEHRFQSIRTTPQAIHDLVAHESPDRVVIEIGPLAGWIHDLVRSMEVEVQVANPNHEAWRWRRVKHKNDRLDALKAARLSAMNQLPVVYMPTPEVRAWRELIQYRQALVRRRTQIKNSIRAMLMRHQIKLPAGKNGWSQRSLAKVHELALIQDDQVWRAMLAEELVQYEQVEPSIGRIEQQLDDIAAMQQRERDRGPPHRQRDR